MSGIYIKSMEMPTSCSDCPMCYDMIECTVGTPRIGFWKKEMNEEPFDFCTERHPRCPLVPVPEHGRLIDADVLLNDKGVGTQIAGWEKMFHETSIAYAPTIIPADLAKEEEG